MVIMRSSPLQFNTSSLNRYLTQGKVSFPMRALKSPSINIDLHCGLTLWSWSLNWSRWFIVFRMHIRILYTVLGFLCITWQTVLLRKCIGTPLCSSCIYLLCKSIATPSFERSPLFTSVYINMYSPYSFWHFPFLYPAVHILYHVVQFVY